MTSKIVVNNIEADAGVSTVFFHSDIGATDGTLNVDGNLTVDGVITATTFSGVDTDKISEGNTEVETIDTGSDGHVKITTEGTEKLRITSAGKIGINDANPERSVDIRADNCMIQLEGTGGNGRQYSLCSSDDTTGNAVDGGPSGTFAIYDDTASLARLRITSAGDVAIGVANPTSFGPTLQVAGTDPALLLQDTATAVDYFGVNVTSGITQLWYDDAAALTINTASGISGSGLVERLRIASNGLVGIGTAVAQLSSSERLSVNQALTVFRLDSATTGPLYLRNGNFSNTNNPYLVLQDTFGNRGGVGIANNDSAMFIHGQNGIRFRYGGTSPGSTEAMRISNTGNVGVNTDNPGVQAWRSGKILDIHGGAGNVTGELHIGANRGDGSQSVGSINFYDNTQNSSHRHVAVIEVDKVGSGTNTRGGDILFYNKVDGGTSTPVTFKIRSGGNCEIPDGNLVLASGHGIDFSATADSSSGTMTSELLDDYEEGVFTPSVTAGYSGVSNASGWNATGYYVKVGQLCHISITMHLNSTGYSSSTRVRIGGFPFIGNSSNNNFAGTLNFGFGNIDLTNYNSLGWYVPNNQAHADLYSMSGNTGYNTYPSGNLSADWFQISGTYIVD